MGSWCVIDTMVTPGSGGGSVLGTVYGAGNRLTLGGVTPVGSTGVGSGVVGLTVVGVGVGATGVGGRGCCRLDCCRRRNRCRGRGCCRLDCRRRRRNRCRGRGCCRVDCCRRRNRCRGRGCRRLDRCRFDRCRRRNRNLVNDRTGRIGGPSGVRHAVGYRKWRCGRRRFRHSVNKRRNVNKNRFNTVRTNPVRVNKSRLRRVLDGRCARRRGQHQNQPGSNTSSNMAGNTETTKNRHHDNTIPKHSNGYGNSFSNHSRRKLRTVPNTCSRLTRNNSRAPENHSPRRGADRTAAPLSATYLNWQHHPQPEINVADVCCRRCRQVRRVQDAGTTT